MDHLVTVAVLYGLGLPISATVVRSRVLAIMLAPLCTGLLAVLAVVGSLLSGTALAPWLVVCLVTGWASAALWWLWVGRQLDRGAPTLPWWAAGPVLLLTAPALLATNAGAIEWDARSIWWFHAAWFRQGGVVTRAAMNNDAFRFAHADYPPFASATEALVWTGYHDLDRLLAKAVSAHLTVAAVALLCLLLVRLAPATRRWSLAAAAALAGLFGLGLFGVGNGNGTSGLVDLLWAVLLAAGAVALLIAPRDRDALVVGWVAVAAAGLTKNEALSAIVLLLIVLAARNGRQWRPTAWAATAALPAVAWVAVRTLFTDATNDAVRPGGVVALLTGEHARTTRVGPTMAALWGEVGSTFAAWLAIAVIGAVVLRRQREALGLGAAWMLPALAVGIATVLSLVYVTGEQDIDWWLMTSISRTTIALRVLLLTDVFLWLLTAGAALRSAASARDGFRIDNRP